jgi:AcrR family transcriptional regulator
MARPQKAVREQHLSETRQLLLEAAASEFAREGYVGANINHISSSAGFAKGTIYNYFPSKRALMVALINDIATSHIAFILEHVDQEDEPCRQLTRFFQAGFAFVERHPVQARVIINAVYGPDAEFKARVYQAYDRLFVLLIHDIIETGIAQGVFRPVDTDVTGALIMTVYLGSCSQLDADDKIWLDPEQVVAFILDGLRTGNRPSEENGGGSDGRDHLLA